MVSSFVWDQKEDGCFVLERGHRIESVKAKPRSKVLNNILEANGNTPLSKLNKIPRERNLKCNIYVKLEFFNVGGSLEDRAAIRMIEVAEQHGLTKENTVVAPASGNIAIGIALVCAVKGYKCVIIAPDRTAESICNILKALNAQVVRVSDNINDIPSTYFAYAKTLSESIKNSYFLDETVSGANPLAHYETTAAEIISALNGKVDLIVVPIRTGAAFIGIAKYIQKHQPKTKVYGVCSKTSRFPHIPELSSRDLLPDVELSCGTGIEAVCSKEAFLMTRRLIKEEGLMVGPSSGAAIVAALKVCLLPSTLIPIFIA
ncbi:hypothetical protein KIN20_031270 [Parelaphostrongylus tenuis]|uniref:Tryptophan synthase beta chain-like PALP domain-containing protein n=1 Tax=Parelaphostrongylus tenuis TaxID=148309 RepID=A0AAD5WH38_PARTN|nr:hypothetical protein KIN20_031270 [Parelaphostrongylus tenuis]